MLTLISVLRRQRQVDLRIQGQACLHSEIQFQKRKKIYKKMTQHWEDRENGVRTGGVGRPVKIIKIRYAKFSKT